MSCFANLEGLGHDQLLFINSIPPGGRIAIADFSTGRWQIKYWENWGQNKILDGWIAKYIQRVGNFALEHDQLFLLH